MGIKNIINKAGAKAADKVAKLSALSPEQLKQVEEQREKYLADQPNISDEELTNRLLASCESRNFQFVFGTNKRTLCSYRK